MRNLLVFVSSFGFGHLTRTIAIVRLLLSISDQINIILIGPSEHCSFFQRSLREDIKEVKKHILTHKISTDIGLYYDKFSLKPEINQSINHAYDFYVKNKSKIIAKLENIIKDYSNTLIYSDISPLAFDLAAKSDIYSIAISNFDWYSIFKNLPVKTEKIKQRLEKVTESLQESYNKSDLLIKLPLSDYKNFIPLESKEIIEVGFFSRQKSMTKSEFRDRHRLSSNDFIAFVSLGMRLQMDFTQIKKKFRKSIKESVKLFTSHINNPPENVICIPSDETEGQNWIGNSDVFIGKPGWGSISECVMNEVKMILVPIQSNVESRILINKCLDIGGTLELPSYEFEEMEWISNVQRMMIPEYKKDIDKTGATAITDQILNLL